MSDPVILYIYKYLKGKIGLYLLPVFWNSVPKETVDFAHVNWSQGWHKEFSDGGLTLLTTRGLKCGFQGTKNAKSPKKLLFTFRWGASMLQQGAIAPSSPLLAPPLTGL